MKIPYFSFIKLVFNIFFICWHGSLAVNQKKHLQSLVKVCRKIASTTLNDLRDPNKFSSPKKEESILADPVQPL